ncbi:MAG TPA: NPCBM/NEW2 domain-containing protein [Thermoguttaceae bacterium]|nr:NPCBM/NEW2 domain-containing protein [Thermoguttaceae bacterium]
MVPLLLALTLGAAAPEFEVRTLTGQTVTGTLESFDAQEVTLGTADGPVKLPLAGLMEIVPKQKATPAEGEPGVWVELVDGSTLVGREYTTVQDQARITLLDGRTLDVPAGGVANVRLQAASAEVEAEWSRILDMELTKDLLVLRNDDAVDYHKGHLEDVDETVARFNLDGSLLPIKRSKILGLRYYHPADGNLPEAVCLLGDATGSRWWVSQLALSDGLQWTTPGGLTVARPLAEVTKIDFSGGKIVFLSDLQPESVDYTPYFGAGRDLPVLGKFFGPRMDMNLESGPLKLGNQAYDKGLALHSRTKMVYRLPDRFRRLKAVAGIDDGVRPHGDVRLVIQGDDQVLLDEKLTGTDPPKPIDLDVTGVRRITILVDFGEKLDVADHLDLCEARVTK